MNYNKSRRERNRQKREARRKEKKEGRLSERRLGFILHLMRQKKLTYAELSRITGLSKQNLHQHFEVDDNLKLSLAQQLCRDLGYELSYRICNNNGENMRNLDSSNMPPAMKCAASDPTYRLHELAVFLINRELSALTFMRATGIDRGKLYRTFAGRDDILISTLLSIVSSLGCQVTWTLTKLNGNGPSKIKVSTKPRGSRE